MYRISHNFHVRSLHFSILNLHSAAHTIHLAIVTLGSVDNTVIVVNTIPAVNTVHVSYGFQNVAQRNNKNQSSTSIERRSVLFSSSNRSVQSRELI